MNHTPAADQGPPALRLASTGTLTHGLPVAEVLGASTLHGARLVAGRAGLGRVVQRLNVMEVPDVLAWVKPNELLLTTGYPLRGTPQSLPGLVAGLDERGLAALAVKLGRYLDALPDAMLAEADRRGFPVILLPDDVGFDDILNQVLTDILNRQAAVLARTEEVHRALVQIVLCGGGLQEIVDEVALLLEVAVVVLDAERRTLAGAGPAEHVEAMRRGRAGEPEAGFLAVPVVAGGFDHGRIIAYGPPGALGPADQSILERAALVAALVVTKQQAVAAVESKYRADFLRDVLSGRAGGADRIVAHCAGFGWDLDRPVVAVVAELDGRAGAAPGTGGEGGRGPEERAAQERLAAAWTTAARRHDPGAAVVSFAHEVVAVVAGDGGRGGDGAGAADGGPAQAVAREAAALFAEHPAGRRTFSTGISRPAPGPSALPEAYEQAAKAVRVGRQLHGDGARAHFDQLGVYRLLSLVSDPAELHAFVRETLGALAGDDEPELVDLRRTLGVLLETNLNVAETARRLHFHYNTLRYRIGKLERLLGPFTEDAHLRLNLTLALHVLRMRGI
ncbi:PucR family transcriptional regulator [Actinomadura parmotrematis]|uniref:PucR family transcriptional regulator ligand-binding domain-containing protein n=1 Tax=Actinomadura parmotrematis TaxID=2864039 RepID=A0ABS7FMG0_9ACTN|nr:PucR family transcriptional regulator ligand-binding domain-containing protein [Actinomadura parmotrematis]MBW8480954.1 PucR family transcriptional regulator ligand-binding domain-containing protein [Actinomadura parmotrematis]